MPLPRWMFHATAMGPSYEAMLDPLRSLLGCTPLHLNASDVPGIRRRGGMTWIADGSLELAEPHGPDSPVSAFLDRFGGGMHSVALQVDDMDAALGRLESAGVRVSHRPLPNVAFTRPGDTEGLLFQWHSGPHADDHRSGGRLPPATGGLLEPSALAYVAAAVAEPHESARRLGTLFGTTAMTLSSGDDVARPAAMVAVGDCSLGLFRLPPNPEASLALWGITTERARFVAMALTVGDLNHAQEQLTRAGVSVSGQLGDGSLVLRDPPVPFPLILTDRVLPGDPRATSGKGQA